MGLYTLETLQNENEQRRREQVLAEMIKTYQVEPNITIMDVYQHLQIVMKELKVLAKREKAALKAALKSAKK